MSDTPNDIPKPRYARYDGDEDPPEPYSFDSNVYDSWGEEGIKEIPVIGTPEGRGEVARYLSRHVPMLEAQLQIIYEAKTATLTEVQQILTGLKELPSLLMGERDCSRCEELRALLDLIWDVLVGNKKGVSAKAMEVGEQVLSHNRNQCGQVGLVGTCRKRKGHSGSHVYMRKPTPEEIR